MSFEYDDNGGIVDKAAQSFAAEKQALAGSAANDVNEVTAGPDEAAPAEPKHAAADDAPAE